MRAVLTTARMVSRSPTENLYLMLASMFFSSVHTAERGLDWNWVYFRHFITMFVMSTLGIKKNAERC